MTTAPRILTFAILSAVIVAAFFAVIGAPRGTAVLLGCLVAGIAGIFITLSELAVLWRDRRRR